MSLQNQLSTIENQLLSECGSSSKFSNCGALQNLLLTIRTKMAFLDAQLANDSYLVQRELPVLSQLVQSLAQGIQAFIKDIGQ